MRLTFSRRRILAAVVFGELSRKMYSMKEADVDLDHEMNIVPSAKIPKGELDVMKRGSSYSENQ